MVLASGSLLAWRWFLPWWDLLFCAWRTRWYHYLLLLLLFYHYHLLLSLTRRRFYTFLSGAGMVGAVSSLALLRSSQNKSKLSIIRIRTPIPSPTASP
jgi:hypothetical protein